MLYVINIGFSLNIASIFQNREHCDLAQLIIVEVEPIVDKSIHWPLRKVKRLIGPVPMMPDVQKALALGLALASIDLHAVIMVVSCTLQFLATLVFARIHLEILDSLTAAAFIALIFKIIYLTDDRRNTSRRPQLFGHFGW